jgi:phosphopantetheine adenylyltransferase
LPADPFTRKNWYEEFAIKPESSTSPCEITTLLITGQLPWTFISSSAIRKLMQLER